MSRTSRLAALAVVAGLLLTGTGCSDSSSGEASSAQVAAAPARTVEAGTARLALAVNTTAMDRDVSITADGIFDFDRSRGRLQLAVPSLLGERPLSLRLLGDTLFVRIPGLGPAGEFYSLDLSELTGEALLSQVGQVNPTTALELLRGVSSDVEEVGSETVRGEQTTHYRGTVDVAQALERVPAKVRGKAERALAGVESVPFDAYLDGDGRLRKLVQSFTQPAGSASGGQPVTFDSTLELYDFGTPVAVQRPAPRKVSDGSALLRRLAGGAQ